MYLNENFLLKDKNVSTAGDTMNMPRHRWYYYKEGFSPNLVEKAIEMLSLSENDLIVDPFNGSGTVTLTSANNCIPSIGIEVNPFTAFIAETKVKSSTISDFDRYSNYILDKGKKKKESPLLKFSTFTEFSGRTKWLFNSEVLNSYNGGYTNLKNIKNKDIQSIIKLALIRTIMENSNVRRDGKCLRYRSNWKELNYNNETFIKSLENRLNIIREDIINDNKLISPDILCGDSRKILSANRLNEKFSLCITSPPYLNTFDYTDIYRPELFLGGFVNSMEDLYKLRLKTIRSHIQAKWERPIINDFGTMYATSMSEILNRQDKLMHKNIPLMIQAYFEDMLNILSVLRKNAKSDAQLWLVVSTSAYAGVEIPVDMIIGELGNKVGWYLKEIGVLRYIRKRKTRYSKDINNLRESVVIFSAEK